MDRDQIVNLAYEGSMMRATLPFSSYPGMQDYIGQLADVAGVADIDAHSPELVEKYMTEAGFTKGSNGKWANADGSPLQIELQAAQGDPSGRPLPSSCRRPGSTRC